jgi:acyl-CoA reductase-like NAD-dependent aldehyde dehydrogenase
MADASATYTVPLFINGEHRRASESFNVTSPGTGEVLYRCSSSSIEDAEAAVNAASEAFVSWRRSTPTARRDILLKAADVMAQRQDELARYMICETGAAEAWARFNLATAIDMIKDVAGRVTSLEGSFPTTKDADSSAIVMKEPYGVVLAIAPW